MSERSATHRSFQKFICQNFHFFQRARAKSDGYRCAYPFYSYYSCSRFFISMTLLAISSTLCCRLSTALPTLAIWSDRSFVVTSLLALARWLTAIQIKLTAIMVSITFVYPSVIFDRLPPRRRSFPFELLFDNLFRPSTRIEMSNHPIPSPPNHSAAKTTWPRHNPTL